MMTYASTACVGNYPSWYYNEFMTLLPEPADPGLEELATLDSSQAIKCNNFSILLHNLTI